MTQYLHFYKHWAKYPDVETGTFQTHEASQERRCQTYQDFFPQKKSILFIVSMQPMKEQDMNFIYLLVTIKE